MKRTAELYLDIWLKNPRRKPLVLRGARQVGKSTLIRQFASSHKLVLNEINLERHLTLAKVFASLDIKRICAELDAIVGHPVTAPGSILFLDEIQAVPEALPALRYFQEDLPALPVVAAGSLLEFTLADHSFSMPVGRIDYLHLGPMTFREFAEAVEPDVLRWLDSLVQEVALPEAAHVKLLNLMRRFCFVGGMPEAVQALVETGSLQESVAVHGRILQTYEDDFAKYARQKDLVLIQEVFHKLPALTGRKVKYVNFTREALSRDVKAALDLLRKARVCHAVFASSCSGIPLLADGTSEVWKPLFLDVGLMNHACGLDWLALERMDDVKLVNEGAVAEQFVGQHLVYQRGMGEPPALAYWLREGRDTNAEVDYVVSRGQDIFPVEVKAGKSGMLRSLRQFVLEKHPAKAFRFDTNPQGRQTIVCNSSQGDLASFELISLPLYAVCELPRLMDRERT